MLKVILVVAVALVVSTLAEQDDGRDSTFINVDNCGRPNTANREDYDPSKIVGGHEAPPNYWNWQTSMLYFGSHRCGGSIINDRWIATAAHCTSGTATAYVTFRLGSHSKTSGGTIFAVERVINHPAYSSSTTANDIALIKLATRITYDSTMAPVCLALPEYHTVHLARKNATVTGWGTLSSGGSSPDKLHEVVVQIDDDSACSKTTAYGTSFQPSNMICASAPGKDSCQGDSGGPLVMRRDDGKWGLAGIVSWGRGCAQPGYPGVYTRVAYFHDWIKGIVNSN